MIPWGPPQQESVSRIRYSVNYIVVPLYQKLGGSCPVGSPTARSSIEAGTKIWVLTN